MRPSVCFAYALCVCLSLLCVLMVSCWVSLWRGGFSWDDPALQVNWHPVLMVVGLVVLFGNAAVVYRMPFTWRQQKHTWKLAHAGLMLLSLLLSGLGLYAAFNYHSHFNIPHLFSLHSWVGICTVAMFAIQWVVGLAGFLFPCSALWFRAKLKPVHVWVGKAILILSLTSCISGINEKLQLALKGGGAAGGGEAYSSLPVEAQFANSLGLLIVAFGLVVFGLLSTKKCQRPETDDEQTLLLHNQDGTGK